MRPTDAERYVTLVHALLRALNDSADLALGLRTVLARICEATGWVVGEAWAARPDGDGLVLSEAWAADERGTRFTTAGRELTLRIGDGLPGAAWTSRRPVWSEDVARDGRRARRAAAARAGIRAAFAMPVVVDGEPVAVLQFFARERAREDEQRVALVAAVALALGSVMRRRRAEEALHDSEEMLKSLFEYAPDAILAVDRTGRIVQANLQAEAVFGYSRDELRGRSIDLLVPEGSRDRHREHTAAFWAAPRHRPMGTGLHLCGLRKNGCEFPVDITLTPVATRAGGLVLACVRDMTERREAQRRFQRLMESAPDAMILIGPDARLALVNGHAADLFGYTPEELARQPMSLIIPPDHRDRAHRGLETFFQDPRMIHLGGEDGPEICGLRKDGRAVPVQLTISPIESEAGLLAVVAIRDLSERKDAERQREALYRELRGSRERLAALSTRLLAAQETERRAIARELHDEIGQTLTAVSMNLRTLKSNPDRAARAEILDEALTITQRTLRQVRDLALDLRPSMLDDLGLGAALRWYLERHGPRLGCRFTLDDNVRDARYPAPVETTCFRVAQEAITNVARHANAQHVRVVLHDDGTGLNLVVEDDGSGFDVTAARERASRGESFGLLGMEERATLAGGRFGIESRPGSGTRVVARFPVAA